MNKRNRSGQHWKGQLPYFGEVEPLLDATERFGNGPEVGEPPDATPHGVCPDCLGALEPFEGEAYCPDCLFYAPAKMASWDELTEGGTASVNFDL